MASKELIEQVEDILEAAFVQEDNFTVTANAIISTILAALQESTPAMQLVVSKNWGRRTWAEYHQVINASPLGEQSE
ncbi:hypothetical protein ABE527_14380 [Brucella sp. TWI432]